LESNKSFGVIPKKTFQILNHPLAETSDAIAAAIAGDSQLEGLQLLVDAQASGQILGLRTGFELPPLARDTQSPVRFAVVHTISLSVRDLCKQRWSQRKDLPRQLVEQFTDLECNSPTAVLVRVHAD
jgi:hypothetical protein